jgi:YYY domain-containing protein
LNWFPEALRWYGVLFAVSLAAAPWTLVLFRRLPDRGATIVRPLGLLAVIYPSWLLSSLDIISYSTIGLWSTLVVLFACGWVYAGAKRLVATEWIYKLLLVEVVSIVAFFFYVWLHGFGPEIMITEKPMDEALLSASTIASQMPPNDPWLSGHPVNYYYLGYVVHGAVTRMADIISSVGFTFALATTFSMTVVATAGVVYNAVRTTFSWTATLVASALSVFLLAIAGNLHAAIEFLKDPRATLDESWAFGVGWDSSRIIYDTGGGAERPIQTINEFPAFSFLLADLHPHVMALPFTIASLSIALNLLFMRKDENPPAIRSCQLWFTIVVSGAFIGSLYAMNSWDLPTFLLIALAGVFVGLGAFSFRERVVTAGGMTLAALLAWLPFTATFVPLIDRDSVQIRDGFENIPALSWLLKTIGNVVWERTSIGEFLTIFGVPYVAGLVLLGFAVSDPDHRINLRYPRVAFAALFGVALAALLIPMPLLVLCGVPLAVCVLILSSREPTSPLAIATGLYALGFAILITTEFFYIHDVFHNRMNTLFKAYYQIWSLFSIGASIGVIIAWRYAQGRQFVKPVLASLTVAGIALAGIYPVVSARAWTFEFADWKGVDGAQYVGDWSEGDLAGFEWLREHASDDDVVLEQVGCQYQPVIWPPQFMPRLSRVSTFTGIPTVLGWGGTEGQWRAGQPELRSLIGQRENDIQAMFLDPTSELIDQYGVDYIFVGKYELEGETNSCPKAIPYPNAAEPTFPGAGWEEVFNQDEVRIYRRLEGN